MKWLVFKKQPTGSGASNAWFALHEADGTGALFTGPGAWARAMAFVDTMSRRAARIDANPIVEPTC
jgi:hypothetical protein